MKRKLLLLALLLWAGHSAYGVRVADFGAVPDDGKCDMDAINRAIQTALSSGAREVVFEAGTYNLRSTVTIPGRGHDNYIGLFEVSDLALVGRTDREGRPATRLERNVELNNDTKPNYQLDIADSENITVRNFIFTNDPPLGSTGRVIAVDEANDEVMIEVLEGLPAYDGMRCASAHAWNLETGKLKRFGKTPTEATLTIGLNITAFWEAVPGTGARRLKMTGAGFAEKVEIGDGISWHHKATDSLNQTRVMRSRNVVFENIIFPSVSNMGMIAGFNHNLTFRKVRFEPENGNLAVGGRDGLHISMTSGELLIEDCYFKGLRMDPLVIRKSFGIVEKTNDDGSIDVRPGYSIPQGDRIRFWIGMAPQDLTVANSEQVGPGTYRYTFSGELPSEVEIGTALSYLTHSLDRGVVRNSVFEDNFGSAIVNFEENIIVENCVFDNNSYQIKYGPNPVSGGFVRKNVFRNNLLKNTSWIDIVRRGQPSTLLIHSISRFFDNPMHNHGIEIYGNTFQNPHGDKEAVAIDVRNVVEVTIRDNRFENFSRNVLVDVDTTENVLVGGADRRLRGWLIMENTTVASAVKWCATKTSRRAGGVAGFPGALRMTPDCPTIGHLRGSWP